MSVENAAEYLRRLAEDKDFSEAIYNVSGDKIEQMKLINEYGLEFTKEEFKQAVTECVLAEPTPEVKGKQKITDAELESVNATVAFGGLLGAIAGTASSLVYGGGMVVIRTINDIADGKPPAQATTSSGISVCLIKSYCFDIASSFESSNVCIGVLP